MIKIIVDCFGGDRSPHAQVEGSLAALAKNPDLYLILTGDEEVLKAELAGRKYDASRLEIVHAPEVIGCDEKPTDAIRLKRNSSMIKAMIMLRDEDDIAGMVSCGSTGALVTGALVRLGRIPGVIRPAFCPLLPTMSGGIVGICDSGANVTVTAAHLRQFAIMASLYMENVYGVSAPRTALELLKKIKKDIYSRTLYKMGALLMKRMFKEEKEFMNYQNYGGSVLLGIEKVVVKGHGSSNATAVEKCIEQAWKMTVSNLSGKIETEIAKYEHFEE